MLGVLAAIGVSMALVASARSATPFTACLVTDIGGLNDKSFNHDAYLGLLKAEKTLHIKGRVIQSKASSDYIPNLQACVKNNASITIAVGFLMQDAIDAVGTSYPTKHFAI